MEEFTKAQKSNKRTNAQTSNPSLGEASLSKKKKSTTVSEIQDDEDYDPDAQVEKMMQDGTVSEQGAESDSEPGGNDSNDIEQEYEVDTDVGPAINEQLAKVLATMAKDKMEPEKFKQKWEKHKRPANSEL